MQEKLSDKEKQARKHISDKSFDMEKTVKAASKIVRAGAVCVCVCVCVCAV